jgi:hypothetical protein
MSIAQGVVVIAGIVVVIVDYPIASQKGELELLSIFFLIQK